MRSTDRDSLGVNSKSKNRDVSVEKDKQYGLSIRAVIVSIAVIVGLGAIVEYAEWTTLKETIDGNVMPSTSALSIVLVLLFVNLVLRFARLSKFRFADREIITIYCLVAFGAILLSWGFIAQVPIAIMEVTDGVLNAPKHFNPIFEQISSLVMPKSKGATVGFWLGAERADISGVPWGEWVVPMIVWIGVFLVVFWVYICMITMIRRQWSEHEQLTFPLAVPIIHIVKESGELSATGGSVWKDVRLWIGIGVSILLTVIVQVNKTYGFLPAMRYWYVTHFWLGGFFETPPLNVLRDGWPPFLFSYTPLLVGIGYLVSLNLLFNIWFFSIVLQVMQGAIGVAGMYWTGESYRYAYRHMDIGAYLSIAVFTLWVSRAEIKRMIMKALSREGAESIDDSNEPLSYRTAFFGGIGGVMALIVFATTVLQMSIFWVSIYLIIMFLCVMAFARLRAAAGYPNYAGMPGVVTISLMEAASTPRAGVMTGLGFSYFRIIDVGGFSQTMANALESYKMGDAVNIRRRSMTWGLILMFIIATLVGFLYTLPLMYKWGAYQLNPTRRILMQQATWSYTNYGERFPVPNYIDTWLALLGFVIGFVLMALRARYLWWPFDTMGFAMAMSDWMSMNWGAFFIAWVIKALVMRYGGVHVYKRTVPIFVGLIIGFVIASAGLALLGFPPTWPNLTR